MPVFGKCYTQPATAHPPGERHLLQHPDLFASFSASDGQGVSGDSFFLYRFGLDGFCLAALFMLYFLLDHLLKR